jgi:20S proteasome alpha/beta subunit
MADRYSFRSLPTSLHALTLPSLTTFSPSGKLAQIEYALAAVGQGLPSLGIRCSNGVVLASEKPHPTILSDQSSFEKISRITPDAGVVYAGMGPDFRVLVDKARKASHAVSLLPSHARELDGMLTSGGRII